MDALDKDDTHANIQGKETPQTPIKRSQNAEQIFVADMNTKLHNIDHEVSLNYLYKANFYLSSCKLLFRG